MVFIDEPPPSRGQNQGWGVWLPRELISIFRHTRMRPRALLGALLTLRLEIYNTILNPSLLQLLKGWAIHR